MFQTAPPSKELLGTAGTVPQLPLPHPGEVTPHDESYHVVRATLFHHNTMPPLLQPHNQTLNTPYKVCSTFSYFDLFDRDKVFVESNPVSLLN